MVYEVHSIYRNTSWTNAAALRAHARDVIRKRVTQSPSDSAMNYFKDDYLKYKRNDQTRNLGKRRAGGQTLYFLHGRATYFET